VNCICAKVEGMPGEIFAASPIAFQSHCNSIPHEHIPTYAHSWPQRHSDRLTSETDKIRRNRERMIKGSMKRDALN
jgi:hypothetical protein